MIILPGLIDPHVHLRDPGATHKEDFETGTKAALAGGIVTVLDMPNNVEPTINRQSLDKKKTRAQKKAVCDVGFIFGASQNDNTGEFKKVKDKVFGLKVYMDTTTGNLLLEKLDVLEKTFRSWNFNQPILVHAEDATLAKAIGLATLYKRQLHVCHLSQRSELELVIEAKRRGLPVTCEVTPHHLFLIEKDGERLGPYGKMKPPLRSKKDVEFLWKNIAAIDCLATDHAPHTKEEKESDNPPFGVPGLETSLPLMLMAVNEERVDIDDVIRLMHDGPRKIFGITTNKKTFVEVDWKKSYTVENKNLFTKCGWSPFAGMKVKGKVERVYIRGKKVFEGGEVLIRKGFGRELKLVAGN